MTCLKSGNAGLTKYFDLREAIATADVVVIGQFRRVEQVGSAFEKETSLHTYRFSFLVQENLKGGASGELPIELVVAGQLSPKLPAVPIGTKIVFLKKLSQGTYRFADEQISFLPMTGEALDHSGQLYDVIVRELCNVIRDGSLTYQERRTAVAALADVSSKEVLSAFQALLKDRDPFLRRAAILNLLRRDDTEALNLAAGILLNEAPELTPHEKENLAAAIRIGVRSEQAIPILSKLAISPDVFTRRSVVMSLAEIHSTKIQVPLARALGDRDAEVQYWAIVGLANSTGEEQWMPSKDEYYNDPSKYITHWRSWTAK